MSALTVQAATSFIVGVVVNLNPTTTMKKYINGLFLILTSLAFTACGGGSDGDENPPQKGESVEPVETGEAGDSNKT